MSAHPGRRESAVAAGAGETRLGVSSEWIDVSCAWSADVRRPHATSTRSDRTFWIAWRPATCHVATPAGIMPATTSRGTPYAVLYVAPGASAIRRPLSVRPLSGSAMIPPRRLAALRAAIRRLARHSALVRTSGIN